jgi:hypothetical protein
MPNWSPRMENVDMSLGLGPGTPGCALMVHSLS